MNKNFSDPSANTFSDVHEPMSFGEVKNKSFLSKVLAKIRKNNCDDGISPPFPGCDMGTWKW